MERRWVSIRLFHEYTTDDAISASKPDNLLSIFSFISSPAIHISLLMYQAQRTHSRRNLGTLYTKWAYAHLAGELGVCLICQGCPQFFQYEGLTIFWLPSRRGEPCGRVIWVSVGCLGEFHSAEEDFSFSEAIRMLSKIPLMNAPESSVPNFFPISIASLMETFGGISLQ